MKTCLECRVKKNLSSFYVKRKADDGRILQCWPRCKPCHNRMTYEKHGKKYVSASGKGYGRRVARTELKRLVRHGQVKKPKRCSRCRKPTRRDRLEGHHHKGYQEKASVRWVCRPCHQNIHRKGA